MLWWCEQSKVFMVSRIAKSEKKTNLMIVEVTIIEHAKNGRNKGNVYVMKRERQKQFTTIFTISFNLFYLCCYMPITNDDIHKRRQRLFSRFDLLPQIIVISLYVSVRVEHFHRLLMHFNEAVRRIILKLAIVWVLFARINFDGMFCCHYSLTPFLSLIF